MRSTHFPHADRAAGPRGSLRITHCNRNVLKDSMVSSASLEDVSYAPLAGEVKGDLNVSRGDREI